MKVRLRRGCAQPPDRQLGRSGLHNLRTPSIPGNGSATRAEAFEYAASDWPPFRLYSPNTAMHAFGRSASVSGGAGGCVLGLYGASVNQ